MAKGKFNHFASELHINLLTLIKPGPDFLALFIIFILKSGTVNLAKISVGMGANAQCKSNYRRIQRLIDEVSWW